MGIRMIETHQMGHRRDAGCGREDICSAFVFLVLKHENSVMQHLSWGQIVNYGRNKPRVARLRDRATRSI